MQGPCTRLNGGQGGIGPRHADFQSADMCAGPTTLSRPEAALNSGLSDRELPLDVTRLFTLSTHQRRSTSSVAVTQNDRSRHSPSVYLSDSIMPDTPASALRSVRELQFPQDRLKARLVAQWIE